MQFTVISLTVPNLTVSYNSGAGKRNIMDEIIDFLFGLPILYNAFKFWTFNLIIYFYGYDFVHKI